MLYTDGMANRAQSIIHCDMDAFYASVEQMTNPSLKGKPVVVGGMPNSRGVVSTCSYEARKFGIKSAMPLAEAYRRCPGAIFLPPDFAKYKDISRQMHNIFLDYTPIIEPLSLDEAFLDVAGSLTIFGPAPDIGKEIKKRVKEELHLNVSVGVAHNKFLAKLASDLSKPDGFLIVDPKGVQSLLDPLDVDRVWGVGEKTAHRLRSLNIKTIGDLRRFDENYLLELFGSLGHQLYLLARGIDNRPVENARRAKSFGREITFPRDISNHGELEKVVLKLSSEVGRSLRKEGVKGRTVTLKVKYADFKSVTRSRTLDSPTDYDEDIYQQARYLLPGLLVKPVRLVGVSMHNLSGHPLSNQEGTQLSLFEDIQNGKTSLSHAMDIVRDKFGEKSITRARLLKNNRD